MAIDLVPATVIERGPFWTLAMNLNQNLLGRLVLVLARDVQSVMALSPPEWVDLHREIGRTRSALDGLFQPDQYNYAFLMNQDAQVHLHVVPRYQEARHWAGERFEDVRFGELFGHDQRILSVEALRRLANDVRRNLPAR